MAGIYRQRHPERTVLYRVLFHYFEKFLSEYESRFEREHGFLRPVIKDVVEKYLDCGNPMCGFARIRCPDCGEERLLMFSCKTRGFCPSCHSKRREEWGEWMREELLLDVPHRQVVFTVPKMLRLFFDETAGKVCYQYSRRASQEESMHYLEFIARVTSHIPDKGQVMIRYCGLYSNAHRGKIRKAGVDPSHPPVIEDEITSVPQRGWAEMIRKVHEVDPLLCPSCGGRMRIISFIEEPKVIDRIIGHLKLTFEAERPPPPHNVQQELLMAAEERGEYF